MRTIAALSVLLLVPVAVAGCASRSGGSDVAGQVSPTASADAGSPVATGSPTPPSGESATSGACGSGRVTVTELDSGHDLCVTVGTLVEVYLHGTPDARWTAVASDSPALRPVASGKGSVPLGVTAGFFQATAAGTAHVTANRPACPSPAPGAAACAARTAFTLTVRER